MAEIRLKVISPKGEIYNDVIESINIKTTEGYVTILPHHFPLLSAICPSVCHFLKNDELIKAYTGDGILHVSEEEIELIVSAFLFKKDIDIERAKRARERAKERLASNSPDIDKNRAQQALIRAEARIALWED